MIHDFFLSLIPSWGERLWMAIGGAIGAVFGFLFGEVTDGMLWLFTFLAIDYVTGIWAACRTQSLSSERGFRGILKKFLILAVVALSHGLDQMAGTQFIQTAIIFAYGLNEMTSIIENLERAGYGSIVPDAVRQILKIVRDREEQKLDQLKPRNQR